MSKETIKLVAYPRDTVGSAASRRTRASGKIPAIIYGNSKENRQIVFNENEIIKVIALPEIFNKTMVISLNEGKTTEQVRVKEIHRHPCRPKLLHIDFVRV